jgi:hypothetical protein
MRKAFVTVLLALLLSASGCKTIGFTEPVSRDMRFTRAGDYTDVASADQVLRNDPWGLALVRANIGFDGDPFWSGELAIIFGIDGGDWRLASFRGGVDNDTPWPVTDLMTWSGLSEDSSHNIVIRLVDTDLADADTAKTVLTAAAKLTGAFVPQYGPIADLAVSAGSAIADASANSDVLLEFQFGFHGNSPMGYDRYFVAYDRDADRPGATYFLNARHELCYKFTDGTNAPVEENWVVFELTRGETRTFETAKATDYVKLVEEAERLDQAGQRATDQMIQRFAEASVRLRTSVQVMRLFPTRAEVRGAALVNRLREFQNYETANEIDAAVRQDYFNALFSYFPDAALVAPKSKDVAEWNALVTTINAIRGPNGNGAGTHKWEHDRWITKTAPANAPINTNLLPP